MDIMKWEVFKPAICKFSNLFYPSRKFSFNISVNQFSSSSCFFRLMSSVAKIFDQNGIRYSPYSQVNASETSEKFMEDLRKEVGTEHGSECIYFLNLNYIKGKK